MENIVPIFATIAMQSSTHPHKKAISLEKIPLAFGIRNSLESSRALLIRMLPK